MTNNIVVDAVQLPDDIRLRVQEAASIAGVTVSEMIVRLVIQGARCQRNHEQQEKKS